MEIMGNFPAKNSNQDAAATSMGYLIIQVNRGLTEVGDVVTGTIRNIA